MFPSTATKGFAAAFVFFASLVFPAVGQQPVCQEPGTKLKKILTPEQQEYQAKLHELGTQRDALRAKAKAAYDDEMTRKKAGDCPDAMTTYDINICYGKVSETTDHNLKTFDDALRALLGLDEPERHGRPPLSRMVRGPTPDERVAEFNTIEAQWDAYSVTACTAAYNDYYGGTIAPSVQMSCHIDLVRNHLHELDSIYQVMVSGK